MADQVIFIDTVDGKPPSAKAIELAKKRALLAGVPVDVVNAFNPSVAAVQPLEFGDYDGHPFRGNQYQKGMGEKEVADIQKTVKESGGVTFHPKTGKQPTTGTMVSVQGRTTFVRPAEKFFEDRRAAATAIASFLKANRDQFTADSPMMVGGWHDKKHDEVAIDVSERFADVDEAIQAGRDRNQQYVHNIETGKDIPTEGTGDRE